MADEEQYNPEMARLGLNQLAKDHADQLYDVKNLGRLEQAIVNGVQTAIVNAIGAVISSAGGIGALIGKFVEDGEKVVTPVLAPTLAALIGNAFGVEIPPDVLSRVKDAGGREQLGKAIGITVLSTLESGGGELTPGKAPAEKLIGMLSHLAIESWAEGTVAEWLFSLCGFLHELEGLTKLAPEVVQATGLDELGRVGLRPLAMVTVATPLTWYANKAYRPSLLADASVVRAFLRGDYSADETREELARGGYSERRIDMLIKDGLKWLSLDDVMMLARQGVVDYDFVRAQLRAQGYDAPGAEMAVTAADAKYLQAIHDDSLSAVRSAYVDRRISDADFETFIEPIFPDEPTRAAHYVAARTIRDVNTRRLSAGQVKECVAAGVLAIVDYRAALEREGYPPDDVIALELLLEVQLKADSDVKKLRAQKEAEATAAAKAKADADAKKKADAEAVAALKRRGPLNELERAAVRGLIPIARMAEVLRADYDADTVQIYVDDVTAQRADYVANQKRAADAAQRAANRGLSLGQLEQAVMDDVLTVEDYQRQLSRFELAPADQQILVATLRARKADNDAAKRKRADADTRAAAQRINLSTFEQLVRAGIRPVSDYDALLDSLGYNDADRAALTALLQQRIDQDAAARQLRADTAAASASRGLSLEQFRRAVVLGAKTVDDFATWLVDQKYSVDAQAVLLAELRDDVAQADAARATRDASASSSGAAGVPLATVTRAARLGILSPAQYQAELVDRGYAPDDVALELALLSAEIANVKTAGALQRWADAGAGGVGLSLAQLAAAVKAGESTLEQYSARASSLGLSDDDVATLTRVLADQLAQTTAAKARRAQLESTVKPGDVSLAVLEQQVRDGALSLDAFSAQLVNAGLDAVDVDLLSGLLSDEGS